MIPYGIALGACTLVGNSLGEQKPKVARSNSNLTTITSLFISFLVVTTMILLRKNIMNLYTKDPQVQTYAYKAMLVFSIAFMFDWY